MGRRGAPYPPADARRTPSGGRGHGRGRGHREPVRGRRLARPPAAEREELPAVPAERASGTRAWTGCRCTPRSAAMVASIGAGDHMHADFGSGLWDGGPIGIPYVTVPRDQKRVPVSFDYADESDRGRYPIPPGAPVEGGRGSDGDRHVIVVDRSRCRLFELFAAYPEAGGRWRAGSGADLEPPLEPPAPARLDLRGRRRPADPSRARALRRGAPRVDRPRPALHRSARRAGRSCTRPATSRPHPTIRRCPPWASASGSSAASTSRASRASRAWSCGRSSATG